MSRTYRLDHKTGQRLRDIGQVSFPGGSPWAWRNLFMTRPKRRKIKFLCLQVMRGCDAEAIAWPLGNRKPHIYYW
ncbi:hypothetical protein [Gimibacter soli]|uniref:Uncharacterized protein n=1 Tax=Gimibacter soli TaxID=3024400 RepID=A0AAE9XSN2_9PROT|nr:hypothetical protein [Gimibacter soli]WCL55601.1 hypothetical protein PH603_07480 [Gimibacter soli]